MLTPVDTPLCVWPWRLASTHLHPTTHRACKGMIKPSTRMLRMYIDPPPPQELQNVFGHMQLGRARSYNPSEFAKLLSLDRGAQQDPQVCDGVCFVLHAVGLCVCHVGTGG
jgi:hypothetical protein